MTGGAKRVGNRGCGVGLVLMLVLALVAPSPGVAAPAASGDRRVALVLGNGAYESVPKLVNPANDAKAIAVSLQGLGFTVVEGYDLGLTPMLDRIHAFGQAADGAAVALVFYAGHGLQVAGRNYLLPVDAKLQKETDLRREAVEVEEILGEVRQAKKLRVVILDACRDNPFMAQMVRSLGTRSALVGRGFARIEDVEADTLIAFATKADAVAEDGSDGHSPYTTALLQHLSTPGLTVERFFGKVRDSVVEKTQGRQQPFVYGSLGGEPIILTAFEPGRSEVARRGAPTAEADATELAFWDALKASDNPADYQAYLETYPNGRFASLARVRARPRVATAETGAGTAGAAMPTDGLGPVVGLDCTRFAGADDQTLCRRAASGAISAIVGVAALLANGRGVERDEVEAVRLYRLAAERGHAEAETGLGQLLEDGRGAPADLAAAAHWYRLAAVQGNSVARYNLGVLLETGRGVARNEAEAAEWYRLAAAQGHAEAQVTLGLMLESGRGVAADLGEAVRLYRLAADQGNALGQAYLAVMLEHGRGVSRDRAAAQRLYQLAAAQGNVTAQAAVRRLAVGDREGQP